jgi:hypothetical protein
MLDTAELSGENVMGLLSTANVRGVGGMEVMAFFIRNEGDLSKIILRDHYPMDRFMSKLHRAEIMGRVEQIRVDFGVDEEQFWKSMEKWGNAPFPCRRVARVACKSATRSTDHSELTTKHRHRLGICRHPLDGLQQFL